MKKIYLTLLLSAFGATAFGQTENAEPKVTFSGYAELYYSYDFAEPANHLRQPFLYTYNRHNELNLNLGLAKAHYETENMRANIAVMAAHTPRTTWRRNRAR